MRRALLAAVLAAVFAPGAMRAEDGAVRVRRADRSLSMTAARLEALLLSLPAPCLELRPLLAASPAPRTIGKAGGASALQAMRAAGPGAAHPLSCWYILRFADAASRDAALAACAGNADVSAAEPVRDLDLCGVRAAPPASPAPPSGTVEIPANIEQVRAPEALQYVHPDSTILVAVVDTGVDLRHPDLARRIWRNDDPPGDARAEDNGNDQNGDGTVEQWERDDDDDNGYVDDEHGYDFTDAPGKGGVGDALGRDPDPSDEQGHGTHVAGILAADGSLRGVAPFVRLMPLRAAYTTPFGGGLLETDDAAAAIVYAADNGARILNLSWGDTEESLLIRDAVEYALQRGAVIVAAAGNGGSNAVHFPSGEPGVIAVASVDAGGGASSFSNFGPSIALAAPGERTSAPGGGILSLAPGGGRATLRGTSMAAPHVAGAAAILMSRDDHPDAERVRALLAAGARRGGAADWSEQLGHGVLDVLASAQSRDDLVLQVRGPAAPYRNGRLTLLGSVLGGDLLRWRVEARPVATPAAVLELSPWRSTRVLADTLVATDAQPGSAGAWEYILVAETGAGARRETHGGFEVERSAAHLDTLYATAGWRGPEPRWLVTIAADVPVRLEVRNGPQGEFLLADPGMSRRLQLEVAARTGTEPVWNARVVTASGLVRDTTVAAAPALQPWPLAANVTWLDSTSLFLPEPVWGRDPSGRTVVWGRGLAGDSLTTLQAWTVQGGKLSAFHDTRRIGRPAGYADVNGDGSPDLLYQLGGQIVWLVTSGPDSMPTQVRTIVRAERALGLFQLDEDAPYEALLSSQDSLCIYDDASAGVPVRLQVLRNPSLLGFNVWGADAAVGDLDADGRIEIACGDAEGKLAVFERTSPSGYEVTWTEDSGGTYAYDFAPLPPQGFLAGRQRTRSVTGDGYPTVLYEFLTFAPEGPVGWLRGPSFGFLAPENDLGAGSTTARSEASGATWLALVRGSDLYLLQKQAATWTPSAWVPGAGRRGPVLADLETDGGLDLLVPSRDGARLARIEEGWRAPRDLHAESLGPRALLLAWKPGSAPRARVRRALQGAWETLGETPLDSWVDTTLARGVTYEYEVQGVDVGEVRGASNRVQARAQSRPRLLDALPLGKAGVHVRCSNPLGTATLEPRRWRVVDAGGASAVVLQVTLDTEGRAAHLILGSEPHCGTWRVYADSLRDDQNGLLDPASSVVETMQPCSRSPFVVREVRLDAGSVRLEFSRALGEGALDPVRYALTWNGEPLSIAAVQPLDSLRLRLVPGPEVRFVGRGIPYVLRLDAGLRSADGEPLVHPETEYLLRVEGRGALQVFAWPNPVREHDSEVVFAEAAAGTRVRIYNLEGELVRDLGGAVGGGLRWDLRGSRGQKLPSGIYIYVARDAHGSRRGQLVLAR